jgi:hypothetical protein
MKLRYQTKIIGDLDGNIFRKKVKASKHLMRIYDAWGIDYQAFQEYLLPINAEIEITDIESGIIYYTTANVFNSMGFNKEYGDGRQIFLARKYFSQENKYQDKLL